LRRPNIRQGFLLRSLPLFLIFLVAELLLFFVKCALAYSSNVELRDFGALLLSALILKRRRNGTIEFRDFQILLETFEY
jgi:hypothetical protein